MHCAQVLRLIRMELFRTLLMERVEFFDRCAPGLPGCPPARLLTCQSCLCANQAGLPASQSVPAWLRGRRSDAAGCSDDQLWLQAYQHRADLSPVH